jgi:macrolide transport system ATP-binding/permease protein
MPGRVISLFRNLLRRTTVDQALDEELQSSVELLTEEKMKEGFSPSEARRRALIELGGVEQARTKVREIRAGRLLEDFTADLRYSWRTLAKAPGFSLTAIVTLALGIGANAVVFSVLNALILRPVNVPNARNFYLVQRFRVPTQAYQDYLDLRNRNRTFESLIAVKFAGEVGIDTGGNPSTAWPILTSGNYFDALGIRPCLGRFFHGSDENGINSAPYVVLSHSYWRGHFGANRDVVGQTVEINKHPFTIIGVAPEEFRGTDLIFSPAFWIPIVEEPTVLGLNSLPNRGEHNLWVMGRLRSGVTPVEAAADLDALGSWLSRTYPASDEGIKFTLASPGLLGDALARPARAFMAGLMLLAGLILLAACANLGSLFAARAADRAKEVALRLALGSRRVRVLRQLLTEALLVSLAGGAIGLAGSVMVLHGLSAWQPLPEIPVNVPVSPDLRTYTVALLLAVASGLLFGIVPVRQVLRDDPWQVIRTGTGGTEALRRLTLRDLLLILQIAICAVLVTSSLVAVRGLMRSLHGSYGFQPRNAVIVQTNLRMAGYTANRFPEMQRRMLDAVAAIPGVSAVGYADDLPFSLGGSDSFVYSDNTTEFRPTNQVADAMNYSISPDYLSAAGTRLLAGRDVRFDDNLKAPAVALVNRQFAVKLFGSVDKALGGHFKLFGGKRVEVVGVVEDGKYRTLTEDQQPAMFFPFLQNDSSNTFLVVRSKRDPAEMAAALEATLRGLDSGMPLTIKTWTEAMDFALFAARVASVALGVLGLLGAMLAVTGIFGMASYVVSRRLRELGIRMALGAGKREVLRASVGRACRLLLIGSVVGLALGVAAARVLSHIVYQATPKDPMVLGGVIAAMLLIGLIAAWIPARRALAVDPLLLLREE